jgi:hypothetical protein
MWIWLYFIFFEVIITRKWHNKQYFGDLVIISIMWTKELKNPLTDIISSTNNQPQSGAVLYEKKSCPLFCSFPHKRINRILPIICFMCLNKHIDLHRAWAQIQHRKQFTCKSCQQLYVYTTLHSVLNTMTGTDTLWQYQHKWWTRIRHYI